jgi:hypothetical protein
VMLSCRGGPPALVRHEYQQGRRRLAGDSCPTR